MPYEKDWDSQLRYVDGSNQARILEFLARAKEALPQCMTKPSYRWLDFMVGEGPSPGDKFCRLVAYKKSLDLLLRLPPGYSDPALTFRPRWFFSGPGEEKKYKISYESQIEEAVQFLKEAHGYVLGLGGGRADAEVREVRSISGSSPSWRCPKCRRDFEEGEVSEPSYCPVCGSMMRKMHGSNPVRATRPRATSPMPSEGLPATDLGPDLLAWLKEAIDEHLPTTVLPEDGRWKTMDSDQLWLDMVLAITYIGASRPGERLRDDPDIERFRIDRMGEMSVEDVNEIFASYGVRYVSQGRISWKSKAVWSNFRNPRIIRTGRFVLFDSLPDVSRMEPGSARLIREREARRIVIDTAQGFGPKTASDYLTGRGYARHLAVMDVRVSKILAALLGGNPAAYTTDEFYGEWEDYLVSEGLESATVDRVLYQNYRSIMADLAGRGGA